MGLWSKIKGVFGRIYNGARNIVGKLGGTAGALIGSAVGMPQAGAAIGKIAQGVANALPGANV